MAHTGVSTGVPIVGMKGLSEQRLSRWLRWFGHQLRITIDAFLIAKWQTSNGLKRMMKDTRVCILNRNSGGGSVDMNEGEQVLLTFEGGRVRASVIKIWARGEFMESTSAPTMRNQVIGVFASIPEITKVALLNTKRTPLMLFEMAHLWFDRDMVRADVEVIA